MFRSQSKARILALFICTIMMVQWLLPIGVVERANAAGALSTELSDQQMLYLPFEDHVNDLSGKGNHGTASQPLTYAKGIFDKAADMTNGYVALDASKFKFGDKQNFSISFWMKVDGSKFNDTTIVANKNWAAGSNPGFEIGMERSKLTVNYTGASGGRKDLGKVNTVGDDVWHHVAVSYDRSSKASVYLDNVLKGTLALTGTGTIDTALGFNIGADGRGLIPYQGKLDDFRIFSKAITASEVQALYDMKSAVLPSWAVGSKLEVEKTGFSTVQLKWPAATAKNALTGYRVYKNDTLAATVASTVHEYTFENVYPGDVIDFKVEAGDEVGLWSEASLALSYTAVGELNMFDTQSLFLPFEGSSMDASNMLHHGTASAPLTYGPGMVDAAVQMKKEYVSLDASAFKFGDAQDYSVSFWMKADGSESNDVSVISNKDWSAGANPGWEIGMERSMLTVNYTGASGGRKDLSKVYNVGDNQWHHVVVSYDRKNKANVYIDNQLKGSLSIAGTGTIDTSLGLNVGADGKGQYQYVGQLDDFRVFTKALDAGEVQQLFDIKSNLHSANAPIWPANAKLIGASSGLFGYRIAWDQNLPVPNPKDRVGVTQYQIYQNDTLIGAVDSTQSSYTANGLKPGDSVTYRVEAADRLGNRTNNGPSINYAIPSEVWPANSAITITSTGTGNEVELSWPEAFGGRMTSVVSYRLTVNDMPFMTVEPGKHAVTLSSFRPGMTYRVKVEAGDARSGTWTTESLSKVYTMPGTPADFTAAIPDLIDLDFNSSLTKDFSPRNASVTAVGSPNLVLDEAINRQVMELNGVSQYLRIPHASELNPSRQMTLLAQLKASDLTGLVADPYIIAKVNVGGYGLSLGKSDAVLTGATSSNLGTYRNSRTPSGIPLDQYVDVAITFDGQTQILYLNGVEVNRVNTAGKIDYNPSYSGIDLLIGARNTAASTTAVSGFFKGRIGYIKDFSSALSAEQLAIYYKATGIMANATTSYWPADSELVGDKLSRSSYKLAWTPAASGEVTQYRVYWNGAVAATMDRNTTSYTMNYIPPGEHRIWIEAGNAGGNWSINGPHLTIQSPSTPNEITAEPGMKPDLLEFTFAGSKVEDSGPLHLQAEVNGNAGVRYSPQFGTPVLALDGKSSYVRIPELKALSSDFITMAASFSLDDLYVPQTILGKKRQSDYALEYNPMTRKLEAWFYIQNMSGQGSYTVVESTSVMAANQIYHAVATYNGLEAKIYINGMEEGSRSVKGAIGGLLKTDLTMGASTESAGMTGNFMQGSIGMVQLYSKVFDTPAVKQLYDDYKSSLNPPPIQSIRWSIPTVWSIGSSGQAHVNRVDQLGGETEITDGVIYASANPAVASISSTGVITAVGSGAAKLIAQFGAYRAEVMITVEEKMPQLLRFNGPSVMKVGQNAPLQAVAVYGDGTELVVTEGVSYRSESPQLASVSASGDVTARSPGQVIIHGDWKGFAADRVITIVPDQPGELPEMTAITFTGPTALKVGQHGNTVVQAVYSDQSLVPVTEGIRYESSNLAIASIDSNSGEVYAKQAGVVQLFARYKTFNASYTMVVTEAGGPVDPTDPASKLRKLQLTGPSRIQVGAQGSYQLVAEYEDASTAIVTKDAHWSVRNPALLQLDSNGKITGLHQGTSVVTAVYEQLSAQFEVTVYTESTGENPNPGTPSGGGGGGASGTAPPTVKPEPHSNEYVVKKSEIQSDMKQSVITIVDDMTKVVFVSELVQELDHKVVVIKKANMAVTVPGAWLQEQLKRDPAMNRVVLHVTSALTTTPEAVNGSMLVPKSLVLSLEAGSAATPSSWTEPLQVMFPIAADTDRALLGVYQQQENGAWKYVGGVLTEDGIRAEVDASGKYVVLQLHKTYKDLSADHWALRAIQILNAKHVMIDNEDINFNPNRAITRAEFVAMLVKSLKLPMHTAAKFSDVSSDAWYADAIQAAAASGIVQGKQGNRFEPDAQVTREELAVLLNRAYEHVSSGDVIESQDQSFQDDEQIAVWSQASVHRVAALGWMQGRKDGKFDPRNHTTRAEAAQVLWRVLQQQEQGQ